MDDNVPKRYWVFIRRRRERIDPGQLPTDSIPAHKAGGNATYGAFPAVLEWVVLDTDDVFGVLGDNGLCDETGPIEAPIVATASPETITELESFTDVTLQIYHRLLEAERLATREDFQGISCDMGYPSGYIRILREIWTRQG